MYMKFRGIVIEMKTKWAEIDSRGKFRCFWEAAKYGCRAIGLGK